MKKGILLLLIAAIPLYSLAQESEQLGLPGDNLNLYAVMKLFQESETLEAFEQKLNQEENNINNLDLNEDEKIDYIKVIDNVEGNTHTIVLQVAVNEKENQDIAVFTVTKTDKGGVEIQLIGDEDLYGKDYIVEPNYEEEGKSTPNPGYKPKKTAEDGQPIVVNKTTTVQVSFWPVIQFMFLPTYVAWHSPWYWGFYPGWWNPWRPVFWHQYYGYHWHWHHHYYGYYRRWPHYRYGGWGVYYSSRRTHSVYYRQTLNSGNYRRTYSRPETLRDGSNRYAQKYPDRKINNKLPTISRPATGNNSRPATRPSGTKPAVTRPENRPAVTKPDLSRPSVTKPAVTRPAVTKPAVTKPPVTRPAQRPAVSRPSGGGTRPTPRPATARPAARPAPRTGG